MYGKDELNPECVDLIRKGVDLTDRNDTLGKAYDADVKVREGLEAEREAKTLAMHQQLKELEEKILSIEEPYDKKISELNDKNGKRRQEMDSNLIVINFLAGEKMLKAGITTMEQAMTYMNLCAGKHYGDEESREVKHTRGNNIHVWCFGDHCDHEKIYVAFGKTNMLSALSVEKADHIGDYTTNDEYGMRKVKDFETKTTHKSYYRTGVCMREWLDPELVEWSTGMRLSEKIEFFRRLR